MTPDQFLWKPLDATGRSSVLLGCGYDLPNETPAHLRPDLETMQLLSAFVAAENPRRVVELGTGLGVVTSYIAEAMSCQSDWDSSTHQIYSIDTAERETLVKQLLNMESGATAFNTLATLEDEISSKALTLLTSDSGDYSWGSLFDPGEVDMLVVDGAFTIIHLQALWPCLADNALVFVHNWKQPQTAQQILPLILRKGLTDPLIINTHNGLAIGRVL